MARAGVLGRSSRTFWGFSRAFYLNGCFNFFKAKTGEGGDNTPPPGSMPGKVPTYIIDRPLGVQLSTINHI